MKLRIWPSSPQRLPPNLIVEKGGTIGGRMLDYRPLLKFIVIPRRKENLRRRPWGDELQIRRAWPPAVADMRRNFGGGILPCSVFRLWHSSAHGWIRGGGGLGCDGGTWVGPSQGCALGGVAAGPRSPLQPLLRPRSISSPQGTPPSGSPSNHSGRNTFSSFLSFFFSEDSALYYYY